MFILNNTKMHLILIGILLLAGSDDMSPKQSSQTDILLACAEKASTLFPELNSQDDPKSDTLELGKADKSAIRIGRDGHFVFEVANVAAGRASKFAFVCAGNINTRTIGLIEYNGVRKMPEKAERWVY